MSCCMRQLCPGCSRDSRSTWSEGAQQPAIGTSKAYGAMAETTGRLPGFPGFEGFEGLAGLLPLHLYPSSWGLQCLQNSRAQRRSSKSEEKTRRDQETPSKISPLILARPTRRGMTLFPGRQKNGSLRNSLVRPISLCTIPYGLLLQAPASKGQHATVVHICMVSIVFPPAELGGRRGSHRLGLSSRGVPGIRPCE